SPVPCRREFPRHRGSSTPASHLASCKPRKSSPVFVLPRMDHRHPVRPEEAAEWAAALAAVPSSDASGLLAPTPPAPFLSGMTDIARARSTLRRSFDDSVHRVAATRLLDRIPA